MVQKRRLGDILLYTSEDCQSDQELAFKLNCHQVLYFGTTEAIEEYTAAMGITVGWDKASDLMREATEMLTDAGLME